MTIQTHMFIILLIRYRTLAILKTQHTVNGLVIHPERVLILDPVLTAGTVWNTSLKKKETRRHVSSVPQTPTPVSSECKGHDLHLTWIRIGKRISRYIFTLLLFGLSIFCLSFYSCSALWSQPTISKMKMIFHFCLHEFVKKMLDCSVTVSRKSIRELFL